MPDHAHDLPESYRESGRILFEEDKALRIRLRIFSGLILVLLLFAGNYLIPFLSILVDQEGNPAGQGLILKLGAILLIFFFHGLIVEGIRRQFMKKLGGEEVSLIFKAGRAYAASSAFFSRNDYRIIALAPVILLAGVFFILTLLLPADWFWVGFAAQATNLAGGVRYYYTACRAGRHKPQVLISDKGAQVIFYEPSDELLKTRGRGQSQGSRKKKKKGQSIKRRK